MANRMRYYVSDGAKSVPLNSLPEEAWTIIQGDTGDADQVRKLYEVVSVLRRGVDLRANALLDVPWYVYQGDAEEPVLDYTGNKAVGGDLSWLTDLPMLLWLTEAGLSLHPEAFWFGRMTKERQRRRKPVVWDKLRFLTPASMTPQYDEQSGLTGFERRVGERRVTLSTDQVIYFSLPNPTHETDPNTAPAQAAAAAAGVIYNLDKFAASFFDRGAIKATLLSVPNTAPELERKKLKTWYQRVVAGINNAFATEVISSEIEPITIGEGTSEIADTGLTETKERQVATAFGIPWSKLFADAANRAVSEQDDRSFFKETILPDARLIARTINTHPIFRDNDLRLVFAQNEMQIFQTDELERAQTFQTYVNGGMKPSVAAEIAGVGLPDGVKYEDLDPEEPSPEELDAAAAQNQPPQQPQQSTGEEDTEAKRFRAWAKKRADRPDFSVDDFRSDILSRSDKASILIDMMEGGVAVNAPFRPGVY